MTAVVILPTYNERPNIDMILRAVRASVPDAWVGVVDDNSPDGTAELAEKIALDLGQIHVIRRGGKDGLGAAYRTGFAWALGEGFDVVVQMDADGSHDPAVLPRLIGSVAGPGGADCAVGSRYTPGGSIPRWTWRRRMLSRFGNGYASHWLRLPVHDATSGFRAMTADLIRAIDFDQVRAEGYGFQIELAYRCTAAGARFVEVPISFNDRTEGVSKMSGNIVVEALGLVTVWGLRDRGRELARLGRRVASLVGARARR